MNIKTTISRKPWILAVIVFLLVSVWLASGLFIEHETASPTSRIQATGSAEGTALKVQVATLRAESVERTVVVYGRTAPARVATLSAETDGRVTEIQAQRGQRVNQGEALLSLDMRDRRARVSQAQASVREHEATFKAQSSLRSDGYVSETQIAETLAKLEAARTELVRAQLDMENRVIRAPFAGVLKERDVEIGDFVRPGDPVATFVDNLTLIVTGTVAEKDVGQISNGGEASARLVTGQIVSGRLRYVSPVADEATRTFLVELEIDNREGILPAGVTAEMVLQSGQVLAQKISPALLTLNSAGDLGVMIVDADQRARFVPVEIERSGNDGIWVSGLAEVAEIITVGQGYVSPGQKVLAVPDLTTQSALAAGPLN